jgi:HD-GYP domain-containing protein (c-di-GMP phosphodiesterase class II)
MKNFLVGISRIFKNSFKADRVVVVGKNVNSYTFMKICLEDKKQDIKKGGVSILTRREREILTQEKEIIFDNRIIYPFNFLDTLGAIYIKRKQKKEIFTEFEKRWFLSLCEEISICLKIFNLYREERKMIINYVKSISGLLDQYVPTSYLNPKSTLRLIKSLGKKMKLSKIEINSLGYASLLHDAGKIQLPSRLLKKQKPLTDKEYRIIMKHPRKGVEMIKDLDVLKPAIPIILHHHERFDGKGYPSKLKKRQIPLGSRILAVIDAFDAMYFGRPYKKRRSLKEIETELKREMWKQFDPKVVTAFLKILKRKDIRKYLRSLS